VAAPGFRLAVATADEQVVGFTFGHELTADTRWWSGALTPLPPEVTAERPGRTFAIIELAVRQPYRRRRIARRLHEALLAGVGAERATLLVRPEAAPALAAYDGWGYRPLGPLRPFPGAPIYQARVLPLPANQS